MYVYMCVCVYTHIYNRIYLYNGIHSIYNYLGFPGGSDGKKSVCNVGDLGSNLGQEDPLEKGMPTNSSILAWRIAWTE